MWPGRSAWNSSEGGRTPYDDYPMQHIYLLDILLRPALYNHDRYLQYKQSLYYYFYFFIFFAFCFCFFFFLIIQSRAACVNCLYVARFTIIVHSKTQIKFRLILLLLLALTLRRQSFSSFLSYLYLVISARFKCLHKKAKPWRILVVVVKWSHRANGLLRLFRAAKRVSRQLKQSRRRCWRDQQKSNRFSFARASLFFGQFSAVPNFTFCRGREHKTTLFFFSWNLIHSLRIQL